MVLTTGQPLSLTCNVTVTVVEYLVVVPVLEWVVSTGITPLAGDTVTSGVVSTRTVSYDSLLTSHGGIYFCSANMTIPDIVTDHQVTRMTDVTVASKGLELYTIGFIR